MNEPGPRSASRNTISWTTDLIDCLIVGAGPAGLTAALYLRRFHRSVVLADAGLSRARYIERSHNLPGFPDGMPGPELLGRLRRQVADVNGSLLETEITGISARPGGGFEVRTADTSIEARTVLIATGVVDKAPILPGLEEVVRRGLVRQCPICDGHEHTGQRIAVLGDGPHAQREAMFISHFSRPVHLVGLAAPALPSGDGERFNAAVQDGRVKAYGSPVAKACLQADGSIGLELRDGTALCVDVIYAALGCQPRSALAQPLGAEQDEVGHLVVDPHCATSVPGLYAAGDVVSALDQLAVAMGHGAIAATAIHRHCLESAPHPEPAARPAALPRMAAARPSVP